MQTFKNPILIVVLILIAGGGLLLTFIKFSTKSPFPLDDFSATYTIRKINNNFMVTYKKDKNPITIYVGKSEINLAPYVDRPVKNIKGNFRTKKKKVWCIKAPCNPTKTTILDISDISLKTDDKTPSTQKYMGKDEIVNNVELKLTGTLINSNRPAPDIAYDFILQLQEPLHGWDSRGDDKGITSVYIYTNPNHMTPEIRKQLKNSVGQIVTLKGKIQWGYAENSHLIVEKVLK